MIRVAIAVTKIESEWLQITIIFSWNSNFVSVHQKKRKATIFETERSMIESIMFDIPKCFFQISDFKHESLKKIHVYKYTVELVFETKNILLFQSIILGLSLTIFWVKMGKFVLKFTDKNKLIGIITNLILPT